MSRDYTQHYARFDSASRKVLLVLVLILFLPSALSICTEHDRRSQWEKRELALAPYFTSFLALDEYFLQLDDYINDHIGLALEFNRLYRMALYYVFRESPVENVTYGKNGFIFFNSHSQKNINSNLKIVGIDGLNPIGAKRVTERMDAIFDHFEQRGYQVSFGIPVSKPALYPEQLPDDTPPDLFAGCMEFAQADNFLVKLHNNSTQERVIHYPQREFLTLKESEHFYPKGSFHWRGMSAHIFAKGFLERLNIEVDGTTFDEKTLRTTGSDLRMLGFERQEKTWKYDYRKFQINHTLKSPELISENYEYVSQFSQYTTEGSLTQDKALLITDSFGIYTAEHLAPGFKTLIHVNVTDLKEGEMSNFYGEMIDKIAPDRILFLFNDQSFIGRYALNRIRVATVVRPVKESDIQ